MGSKSTFSNSTSKSYARALYELAQENSEVEKIEIETNGIKKLINENNYFKDMILSPVISPEEKKSVIFKIVEKYNFCSTHRKFLGFLTSKNRLFFLGQIIENFLDFLSRNKGELNAKLFSSKELSKEDLNKIKNELSLNFKSPIKIKYKYDPGLIGGLIIQVGSIMIDNSIKSKLKIIEKNMIEA